MENVMCTETICFIRVRLRSETVQRFGHAGRLREIRAGTWRAGTNVGQTGTPGSHLQSIPVIALHAVAFDSIGNKNKCSI